MRINKQFPYNINMFAKEGQATTRTNNHMSNLNKQEVMIDVVGNSQTTDEMELLDYLSANNYAFDYYIQLEDMARIRDRQDGKMHMVVLMAHAFSEQEFKKELDKNISEENLQKTRYYTYPVYVPSLSLNYLKSHEEVGQTYSQHQNPPVAVLESAPAEAKVEGKARGKHKSIRLAGVHSIDRSFSSTKNITKVKPSQAVYESIFYVDREEAGYQQPILYQKLVRIFRQSRFCLAFDNINKTINRTQLKDKKKKILMIAPQYNSEVMLEAYREEKNKDEIFDMIFVGDLKPSRNLMRPGVVMATNRGQDIYQFLQNQKGMTQNLLTDIYEIDRSSSNNIYTNQTNVYTDQTNLMATENTGTNNNANDGVIIKQTSSKDVMNTNYQFGGTQANEGQNNAITNNNVNRDSSQINVVEHSKGDQLFNPLVQQNSASNLNDVSSPSKVDKQKHKIKKVKSPGNKSKIAQEQEQIPENILINIKSNQTDKKSEQQIAPIPYVPSSPTPIVVRNPNESSSTTTIHNYQSSPILRQTQQIRSIYDSPNQEISSQMDSNRYYQKNSSFRNPSNIIPETSQEHRGSNKQSFVNLDSEYKNRYTTVVHKQNNLPPLEQKNQKIIVNHINQQPETHYIQSTQTIQSHRVIDGGNRYGGINRGNYQNSGYQSPSRFIKKEEVYQPQEIKQEENVVVKNSSTSMKSIGAPNRQFSFGTPTPSQPTTTTNNVYQGYTRNSEYDPSSRVKTYTSAQRNNISTEGPKRTVVNNTLNLEGYEKVEVNGIMMYRKKADPNTSQQTNVRTQVSPSTAQVARQSITSNNSPRVIRYEASPRRDNNDGERKQFTTQNVTYRGTYYSPSSPTSEKYQVTNYSSNSYSPRVASYSTSVNGVPSYKSSENQYVSGGIYQGGRIGDRVQVQRREYRQQKVQSPSPVPIPKALNESNWMNRPSDLHSDGSMMRRNNIKFGIKTRKRDEFQQSAMESKLSSGFYAVRDLKNKVALTRKLTTPSQIKLEEEKYGHVNPQITPFHYLFQEELKYFSKKLSSLFSKNDKIDYFWGVEDVFQKTFHYIDCGFVIISQEQQKKLNQNLLPQDYFIIKLKKMEHEYLQINQQAKTVTIDSMERLPLARKIILDRKLYQYVLVMGGDAVVQTVSRKFDNTEFIVEKVEVDFSEEYLDCYYEELPQLTRVYVLCREDELEGIQKVVESYAKSNSAFQKSSLRIIVIPRPNSKNKSNNPMTTFLHQHHNMTYKNIIAKTHVYDKQTQLKIKSDMLYLHEKHQELMKEIESTFPYRFQFVVYRSLGELGKNVSKPQEGKWSSYLVLHESVGNERIGVENYSKVFMMGRAKTIPNKVVRVIRKEQLIQLLKK